MSETQNRIMDRLIDWHIEQTITDEMAQRILTPVLERIRAGEFDEQLRKARLDSARKQLQEVANYWYIVIV